MAQLQAVGRTLGAGGRVMVVGSVNIDLVVTLERLPGPGETVVGGRFAQHHGGKGGNQATAAARLGAETAFVGAVGRDAFGAESRAALKGEGIDLRGLVSMPGEVTGVALILVDATGENSIAVAGGANRALRPGDVRNALGILQPRGGDVILVGHEIPTLVTREALRIGREAGATTILNPAPAGDLDAATLRLADILTPNRGELAMLAGALADPSEEPNGSAIGGTVESRSIDRVARRLLDGLALGAVLVSLGPEGALLVEPERSSTFPATAVDVVDSTGAGDTLNGVLAAGLAAGWPVAKAAARAVLAASIAVSRAGARDGMPSLADVQAAGG